jgi:hypothetical protein
VDGKLKMADKKAGNTGSNVVVWRQLVASLRLSIPLGALSFSFAFFPAAGQAAGNGDYEKLCR